MGGHAGNNFDAVRLVAALAVVASHHCLVAGIAQPTVFGPLTPGDVAVLAFFSVSGYLVAASWAADATLWRFAARRFLRVWPAYLVVIVATCVAFAATDPHSLAPLAAGMYAWKHLTLQSFDWSFFPALADPRLNAPLWTIVFEIRCYALFALLAVALRGWWPRVLVAAGLPALAWWTLGRPLFDPSVVGEPAVTGYFCAFFGAGVALCAWPVLRTDRAVAALVACGLVAYVAGSPLLGLVLAIPAVVVFVGTRSWPVLRRAGRFGDLSYGIYLWGWPVQQVVATRLGPHAGYATLLATSLAVVVPLAALSWHLVEKRALRAKPSLRTAWPQALKLTLG